MAACLFAALGVWQVQRLHWKHDLIARVNARVHAEPIPLPATAKLAQARDAELEYTRVSLRGTYRANETGLVRAATELGTGYWVMTVLKADDGRSVWINRGYVPSGTELASVRQSTPNGPVEVIGLVRLDEPGGSLLQANKPDEDRWYSRDLKALAKARKAGETAPVFVDAQTETIEGSRGSVSPVPGLTVIHFPDNHLVYAITWFSLATLSLFGIFLAWRRAGRNVA